MLARRRLAGLVWFTCSAFACAADTGGQGTGISKEDAPEKFAALLCEAYYACECADIVDPSPFTSEDQCKAEIAAEALADIDTAELEELTYDEECAAEAFAYIDGVGCDGVTSLDLEGLAKAYEGIGCKVYYGNDELGDPCEYLSNYSDSCAQGGTCQNGTCVEIEQLPDPGDDCDQQWGLCSENAICLDIDGGQDLTCEILPPAGESCLGTNDICAVGLACDQGDKTCGPAPGAGETCAPPAISACEEGLFCDVDVCAKPPTGGEACAMPDVCAQGFTCRMGQCMTDPPLVCAFTLGALG